MPALFLRAVRRGSTRTALRQKDYGLWQEITWNEYLDEVRAAYDGLADLGLTPGETVVVFAHNRPEWMYIDLAVQAHGCMTVGLYVESQEAEVQYIIGHCGARIAVCDDQEQVDKVLAVRAQLPNLEHIVFIEPKGMREYDEPGLVSYARMRAAGLQRPCAVGLEEAVARLDPESPAILLYTSGTTGNPKGVVLSHANVLAVAEAMTAVDPIYPGDEVLSYLPMAWVGERMFSLFFPLVGLNVVNFPERNDMQVVLKDLKEVLPSILFCPPRVWENMCAEVYIRAENADWLKRLVFGAFMPLGQRVAELEMDRQRVPLHLRLLKVVGEWALFRWIRNHLGLSYVRQAFTGGAAIGPEVFTFFHSLGIRLRQVYGQTEIAGICCVHREHDIRPETVGLPLPGAEVQITAEGEILLRSPAVFKEYLNDPAATARTKAGGWLHTGDKGYFDADGQLVVIDRQKDVYRTAAGTEFSPQNLENRLKFSHYIKEAVVVGDGRDYPAALIQIDYGTVGNWAQRRGITYTTFRDLAAKPETEDLIRKQVDRLNQRLEPALQIRQFALLTKELDADDGELTRTSKVRRDVIAARYAEQIAALYSDAAAAH